MRKTKERGNNKPAGNTQVCSKISRDGKINRQLTLLLDVLKKV